MSPQDRWACVREHRENAILRLCSSFVPSDRSRPHPCLWRTQDRRSQRWPLSWGAVKTSRHEKPRRYPGSEEPAHPASALRRIAFCPVPEAACQDPAWGNLKEAAAKGLAVAEMCCRCWEDCCSPAGLRQPARKRPSKEEPSAAAGRKCGASVLPHKSNLTTNALETRTFLAGCKPDL